MNTETIKPLQGDGTPRKRGRPAIYTPEERKVKYTERQKNYYEKNYEYIRELKINSYRQKKSETESSDNVIQS